MISNTYPFFSLSYHSPYSPQKRSATDADLEGKQEEEAAPEPTSEKKKKKKKKDKPVKEESD